MKFGHLRNTFLSDEYWCSKCQYFVCSMKIQLTADKSHTIREGSFKKNPYLGRCLEYRNRSYIEVRRGDGFWPMGPALYRVIYVLSMVPNTVEQGKYSWNSLLGQWCWAMWPQERHLLLSACLLSVVCCQLSFVSCQLSVVSCQLSKFPHFPGSRTDAQTVWPHCSGLQSQWLVSLYIEQPENICVRRTERQEPRAGYWRYRRRQLGSLPVSQQGGGGLTESQTP